ncbi:hypothetical protein SKC36_11835 [Aquirufa sp. OSTEICH-129A]
MNKSEGKEIITLGGNSAEFTLKGKLMENLLRFRWTSWYMNFFIVLLSCMGTLVDFIKALDWIPFTYFWVDTRYVLVALAILFSI